MKMWDWVTRVFGQPLSPLQILRRSQRALNKAIRKIDRERLNLERQEQKLIVEIKKVAQKNQPDVVRIMANDLVRTRGHIRKLMKMKANLQGISLQMTTLESQRSITQAVYNATMVLRGMNRQLNMPQIHAILKEFEKQTGIMEIKEEMVNETIDDVMEHEDDGEESEDIVTQILDELGLQIDHQLPEAPQDSKQSARKAGANTLTVQEQDQCPTNPVDDELLARLERLRKE